MTSLLTINTRMAVESIRANKSRSLLTILGIVVGVASVILTISLGEGVRRQVAETNQSENSQLTVIRSGKIAERTQDGTIQNINYLAGLGINTLTHQDYESIKQLPGTSAVVPLATVSGSVANFEKETYQQAVVLATTSQLPIILDQQIAYGDFFDDTTSRNVAIIGKRVAEELYQENVPLGKLITIRGQDFIVGGVFDEFQRNPFSQVTDLNKAVFIAYPVAQALLKDNPNIYQITVVADKTADPQVLTTALNEQLLKNHGGQEDFSVLSASEVEQIAKGTIAVATSFVAGIATISLIVGGIGIMNIMFVSVTERTREIGVRKSLGATNRQIYSQFLIEATALSVVGGIFGIIAALSLSLLIRITTDLQPAITWQTVVLAVLVSAIVGIVFGTVPAIKAARKDPIESLRYE
jgi:putative ABC transport system permease protein